MVEIKVILDHLTDFFHNTSIMGTFTLMFHVRETIAVGALTEMDTFIGGMIFETPPTLLDPGLFVVPPIRKGIGGTLGLRSFFLGDLSGDVVDDWRGDVVIGIGCP